MIRRFTNRALANWKLTVLGIAALAFVVRMILSAATDGGSDLRIYTYFAQLVGAGQNPYDAPPNGAIAPFYGDNAPLEMVLFAGLLEIHKEPIVLRTFFALVDVALLLVVGFHATWFSKRNRLWLLLFLAFNPFVLLAWTVYSEDKPLLMLAITLILCGIATGRLWLSWLVTALSIAVKFFGLTWLVPLGLYTIRKSDRRAQIGLLLLLISIVAVSLTPYFPDFLVAFERRSNRLLLDPPIHASLLVPLAKVGLYTPVLVKILSIGTLVAVYWLFIKRKITVAEAVVFSAGASFLWLPDESANRILAIALPLLLLFKPSKSQWIALWVITCFSALAFTVQSPAAAGVVSHFQFLKTALGEYGSLKHVFEMNIPAALIFVFYLIQRQQGPLRIAPLRGDGQTDTDHLQPTT